jgi:hypothetical protein
MDGMCASFRRHFVAGDRLDERMRRDVGVLPQGVHERVMANDGSAMFDEVHQNIEGARLERHVAPLALDASGHDTERDVAERENIPDNILDSLEDFGRKRTLRETSNAGLQRYRSAGLQTCCECNPARKIVALTTPCLPRARPARRR